MLSGLPRVDRAEAEGHVGDLGAGGGHERLVAGVGRLAHDQVGGGVAPARPGLVVVRVHLPHELHAVQGGRARVDELDVGGEEEVAGLEAVGLDHLQLVGAVRRDPRPDRGVGAPRAGVHQAGGGDLDHRRARAVVALDDGRAGGPPDVEALVRIARGEVVAAVLAHPARLAVVGHEPEPSPGVRVPVVAGGELRLRDAEVAVLVDAHLDVRALEGDVPARGGLRQRPGDGRRRSGRDGERGGGPGDQA